MAKKTPKRTKAVKAKAESPIVSPTILGLMFDAGSPQILEAFDRKDVLPAEFDRAFAGITEPGGCAVYNFDALCSILAQTKNLEKPEAQSYLDDLIVSRKYGKDDEEKGREVVFVSFGCAVVSKTNQVPPAWSS